LQQIRCFCAAVELGSFTAAAASLRVSQPAVAEQIRKLEQALGADLFVRAGRGVALTEAGRAFAEPAARSLRAVEEAADGVGELAALRSGTVAIGVFGGPSAWRMDELATAFLRRHPNVSLRLVGRNSSAIADRVRHGELEAGVVLLPIDDDRLDVRPIVRDEVLYVSADPERTRQPASIEQLATAPLVFYDAESADDDPIRRQLADRAQASGFRLQPKVEVELKDIALRLVAAGIGDTYLPSAYTRAPYYPEGLHTASFAPALYDTFAIITRPGARLSTGVRELLGDVEAHARDRGAARPVALTDSPRRPHQPRAPSARGRRLQVLPVARPPRHLLQHERGAPAVSERAARITGSGADRRPTGRRPRAPPASTRARSFRPRARPTMPPTRRSAPAGRGGRG
jgi:DNA-binding transcriptional LysR family regulator